MIEQKNKAWYVERRGELAAQQFLLELGADSVPFEPADYGFDYLAFFHREDGTNIVVGIAVDTTQSEVKGNYLLSAYRAERLLKINIPILIIVVDVKENNLYFNWIKEAVTIVSGKHMQKVSLLTATPEERERLKSEIQSIQ